MKSLILRRCLILLLLAAVMATSATAQRRRKSARRRQVTPRSGSASGNGVVNPATGNLVTIPAATTPGSSLTAQSLRPDNVFGDTVKMSLRNDNAVEKNLIKDRTPLPYQYIREDDAIWGKRLWEEIDTREKMNMPFRYDVDEDNGSQLFMNILLTAIEKGEVTAFSNINDRFTDSLTPAQVAQQLQGKPDTVLSVDPTTGLQTPTVTYNPFDPTSIVRYRIKEDWIFDKQTSTMYVRILGIAPIKIITNSDGTIRGESPMFWLYYPDLRPILARYDVYNPKNFALRMSWEDLFEMRFFHSYVIKEDNAMDRRISDYIKSGVGQLREGQRIKNNIFNWEQDLWSY
ncbi:MAG: type IX secretion system ring subunit PorN/GldN [Chitinophagaceae bacterium]